MPGYFKIEWFSSFSFILKIFTKFSFLVYIFLTNEDKINIFKNEGVIQFYCSGTTKLIKDGRGQTLFGKVVDSQIEKGGSICDPPHLKRVYTVLN